MAAHTSTVTVPEDETYPSHHIPSPGYADGVATTPIEVVEFGTETVPLVHAPASNGFPPMLPVVAVRF